jgi:hypothetical protein
MPRVAENPLVKKAMTKMASCTKKYRKASRKYYKASAELNRYRGKDTKKRAALYKKSEKAMEKADEIKDECDKCKMNLMSLNVVKSENKVKVQNLIMRHDKDELEWSSNKSSDIAAME